MGQMIPITMNYYYQFFIMFIFKDDNEQNASSSTYDSWESDIMSRFITPSVQVSYEKGTGPGNRSKIS